MQRILYEVKIFKILSIEVYLHDSVFFFTIQDFFLFCEV